MPMFEYHCLDCHAQFERIRATEARDTPVACPQCGSTRAKRTISAFATIRVGGQDARGGVATSGGGGCACGGQCGCR